MREFCEIRTERKVVSEYLNFREGFVNIKNHNCHYPSKVMCYMNFRLNVVPLLNL